VTYKKRTLVPFTLPSTLITLQPFLLAADLSVKLHVDGGRIHAVCALLVRRIDASLPSWSGLNVRNAVHPNDRLPLLATVGSA